MNNERAELTPADFEAVGVDAPWNENPIPSPWRQWRAAEDKALAHKYELARDLKCK